MKRSKLFFVLIFLVLISHMAGSGGIASSTPLQPPTGKSDTPPTPPANREKIRSDGSYLTDSGLWYIDLTAKQAPQSNAALNSGGPDIFGYEWDDTVPYEWVDASAGTDTGIDCSSVFYTDAIDIGFAFDFYEHTYSQIYISCYGFVSFQPEGLDIQQGFPPMPDPPNDLIAPLWTPADSINYVKYLLTGISPNQKLVIEWNNLVTDNGHSNFTLEVVLHENGNIDFEYNSYIQNPDGGFSKDGGLENNEGLDGFSTIPDMMEMPIQSAVHITRPPNRANLFLTPELNGSFVSASEMKYYAMQLKNYGALGPDAVTLTVDTDWQVEFFEADAITPLINPVVLDQGDTFPFIARVTAPAQGRETESDFAIITAVSGLQPTVSKSATISSTFPPAFTQILDDQYDDATMSLLKIEPSQVSEFEVPGEGWDRAVLELPNQNILYAWTEGYDEYDPVYQFYSFVRYAIRDNAGALVLAPTTLVDTTVLPYAPDDGLTYLASAPNGNIGMIWLRVEHNSDGLDRSNIYFSVLEPDGEGFVLSPTNVTNKSEFCDPYNDIGCFSYYEPLLEVTQDGRYFLAWRNVQIEEEGPIVNYQFTIRDSSGVELTPITGVTNMTDTDTGLGELTMTDLVNNQVFLAWNYDHYYQYGGKWFSDYFLNYTVLDSNGMVIKPETSLDYEWIDYGDAAQLGDGTIMLAHGYPDLLVYRFDGTTFELLGPVQMIWSGDEGYALCPSITPGPFNSAVVTWQNDNANLDLWQLFYALVASDGEVLTPPISFVNFASGPSGMYNTIASENGQGITSLAYDYTPFFRSEPLTQAAVGLTYTYHIVADDGNLPDDTLVITAEYKPSWMSFSDNGDGTATLTGVPPSAGPYSIVLKVSDENFNSDFQHITLNVIEPLMMFLPFISK